MKNISKQEKVAVVSWLVEHFPRAFFKSPHQVKALKIGIDEEILDFYDRLDDPPFSKKVLREGLNYYNSSPSYLKAQVAKAGRIDVFGNEVDVVTEEQANYALEKFTSQYQKANREVNPEVDKP